MTSLLYLILLRPTVHVPVACAEVLNARTARVELVCYDRRIEWTRKNSTLMLGSD